MPSRLERRYARMPDEELLSRAREVDQLLGQERVVALEEISARRLDLTEVKRLTSPPLARAKHLVRAKVSMIWLQLIAGLCLFAVLPLIALVQQFSISSPIATAVFFTVVIGLTYLLTSRSRILLAVYDDHLRYLPYGGENIDPPSTFTFKKLRPHHFRRLNFSELVKATYNEFSGEFVVLHTKDGEKIFAQCRKDKWTAKWVVSRINRLLSNDTPTNDKNRSTLDDLLNFDYTDK